MVFRSAFFRRRAGPRDANASEFLGQGLAFARRRKNADLKTILCQPTGGGSGNAGAARGDERYFFYCHDRPWMPHTGTWQLFRILYVLYDRTEQPPCFDPVENLHP